MEKKGGRGVVTEHEHVPRVKGFGFHKARRLNEQRSEYIKEVRVGK